MPKIVISDGNCQPSASVSIPIRGADRHRICSKPVVSQEVRFFGGAGSALGLLVWALGAFSALIVGWALIRAGVDMVRMGPLTYFRYALRIDAGTWPLLVILLWIVLAAMIAFVFPTGLSAIGL